MEAWNSFILAQEKVVGKEASDKWLRTLKIDRFDACNLYLTADDPFQISWFNEHIKPLLGKSLINQNNNKIKVHLFLAKKERNAVKEKKKEAPEELDFEFDQLDSSLTFENFVPTDGSVLAFKLLSKLAHVKDDLNSFNPIYLWGLEGTGKTHLLSAAANALREQGLRVHYVRAQTFADHVVQAIKLGQMKNFRKTYRKLDLLIVDDVHIFGKKGATQEEFFHTFNTLHLNDRAIILSSRTPPSELENIEPRLVSRFEWGIVIPLELQSTKELEEILKAKAKSRDVKLSEPVVEFFLENFASSGSKLTMALDALILRTQGNKHPWTASFAAHHLKDLVEKEKAFKITPDKIFDLVQHEFAVPKEEVLGKGQSRDVALPRQFAMYLMRDQLKLPYARIGELFSRDHSTCMTSIKSIQKGIEKEDPEVAPRWRSLIKALKNLKTTKYSEAKV